MTQSRLKAVHPVLKSSLIQKRQNKQGLLKKMHSVQPMPWKAVSITEY